jgi:ABC-type oligopeptide transport system ATPase subunit
MLRVIDLVNHYRDGATRIKFKVLDGVNFGIQKGAALGLVGASGAGKSTLAHCILGLLRPTGGRILYKDRSITGMTRGMERQFRKQVQMIWQDPYSYLNPYMRAEELVREPMENFRCGSHRALKKKSSELLEKLGVAQEGWWKRPHELSGGQCQRIAIARALALDPELLICDEPLSALDAPLQIHILNLLKDLQNELKLTFLFITHDLSVVRHFCPEIAVMHKGKIVETGPTERIFNGPSHPHTQLLIKSRLQLEE